MIAPIDFYASPGPMTRGGYLRDRLGETPGDVASLCRLLQGLMIHVFWADHMGLHLPETRKEEVQLRSTCARLERILELDPSPLFEPRVPQRRVVGNCRDFAVMLTSLLRYHGVPARARCGFARYFTPRRFEDHWVCEYWNVERQRWQLVDAQLDELQRRELDIRFDPLDVRRKQFTVAGKAWQMCRQGKVDPDFFGIFDMQGLWFVRGNLVRDVAALNKVEMLPWDGWGLIEGRDEELSEDDLQLLDEVALLTRKDVPDWERVRLLYESDARLSVPSTITSYTTAGPQIVDLPAA